MSIATVFSTICGGLSSKYGLAAMFAMTAANTGMNIAELSKLKKIESGVSAANSKLNSLEERQNLLISYMSDVLNDADDEEAPKKTKNAAPSTEGELLKFFLEAIKDNQQAQNQQQNQQANQQQKGEPEVTRDEFNALLKQMAAMNLNISKLADPNGNASGGAVKEELPAATIGG